MRKLLLYWSWVLLLLGFLSVGSAQGKMPMWGPEVFVRGTGQPVTDTMYFSVPDSTWQYTIVVQNGVPSGIKVSSATITIDGIVIIGPNEFNQQVSEIRKPIHLRRDNVITVRVAGKPGGAITVAIYGPSSAVTITPQGGTVNLDGIASVTFPPGAFQTDNQVILWVTGSPQAQENYSLAMAVYDAGPRLPYEVRINCGPTQPLTDSFRVNIFVPDGFVGSLPPGLEIAALAQVYQGGGLAVIDHFEFVGSTFESTDRTLHMTLPWWIFTDKRNPEKTFESVIICGSGRTF